MHKMVNGVKQIHVKYFEIWRQILYKPVLNTAYMFRNNIKTKAFVFRSQLKKNQGN